jgi:hypothetical protein
VFDMTGDCSKSVLMISDRPLSVCREFVLGIDDDECFHDFSPSLYLTLQTSVLKFAGIAGSLKGYRQETIISADEDDAAPS